FFSLPSHLQRLSLPSGVTSDYARQPFSLVLVVVSRRLLLFFNLWLPLVFLFFDSLSCFRVSILRVLVASRSVFCGIHSSPVGPTPRALFGLESSTL
ncbi:hypothetical protein FB451DRAFT_1572384, partial [Mycena latifolia]